MTPKWIVNRYPMFAGFALLLAIGGCGQSSMDGRQDQELSSAARQLYIAIETTERDHTLPYDLTVMPALEMVSLMPEASDRSGIENRRIELLEYVPALRRLSDSEPFKSNILPSLERSLVASSDTSTFRIGVNSPYGTDHLNSNFVRLIGSMALYAEISTDADAVAYIDGFSQIAGHIRKDHDRLIFDAEFGELPPQEVLERLSDLSERLAGEWTVVPPMEEPGPQSTIDLPLPTLNPTGGLLGTLFEQRLEQAVGLSSDRRNELIDDFALVLSEEVIPALIDLSSAARRLSESRIGRSKTVSPLSTQSFHNQIAMLLGENIDINSVHAEAIADVNRLLDRKNAPLPVIEPTEEDVSSLITADTGDSSETGDPIAIEQTVRPIIGVEPSFLLQHRDRFGLTQLATPLLQLEDRPLLLPLTKTVSTVSDTPVEDPAANTAVEVLVDATRLPLEASLQGTFIRSASDCFSPPLPEEVLQIISPCRLHEVSVRLMRHQLNAKDSVPRVLGYNSNTGFDLAWSQYITSVVLQALDDQRRSDGQFGFPDAYSLSTAALVVVDTGLHGLGWSHADAASWLETTLELTPDVADVFATEVLVRPGWASAGYIARGRLERLRTRAQQVLSARFSLSEFNAKIVEDGSRSITQIEPEIDVWIADQL